MTPRRDGGIVPERPYMAGNTFGTIFRITTFGESHGPALGVVIDGCPAGVPIDPAEIQREMDRRRPGQSSMTTQRKESDTAEILSGVYEGKTTGTPIGMIIRNEDQKSKDYDKLKDVFRPGHADYTYIQKYGHRDHRGGGRSSARETAARVAAGAVARKLLGTAGIDVYASVVELGGIKATQFIRDEIENNPFRVADPAMLPKLEQLLQELKKAGDTAGGIIETVALNVPAGFGEPVFDKLDAAVAYALMGINAVKGVEIGDGFASAGKRGSENNDPFVPGPNGTVMTTTNHAGGMLGGISNGMPLVARAAFKPTASIHKEQTTVNRAGEVVPLVVGGRHDPTVLPRAVPIVEAMMCLVLADFMLRQRAARV
jgi:chorismate synthase